MFKVVGGLKRWNVRRGGQFEAVKGWFEVVITLKQWKIWSSRRFKLVGDSKCQWEVSCFGRLEVMGCWKWWEVESGRMCWSGKSLREGDLQWQEVQSSRRLKVGGLEQWMFKVTGGLKRWNVRSSGRLKVGLWFEVVMVLKRWKIWSGRRFKVLVVEDSKREKFEIVEDQSSRIFETVWCKGLEIPGKCYLKFFFNIWSELKNWRKLLFD